MGAEGHISLWREHEVREAFPDHKSLFRLLPNTYLHTIDGRWYWHAYDGDYCGSIWEHEGDWFITQEDDKWARLREFVDWLETHKAATWEVWT